MSIEDFLPLKGIWLNIQSDLFTFECCDFPAAARRKNSHFSKYFSYLFCGIGFGSNSTKLFDLAHIQYICKTTCTIFFLLNGCFESHETQLSFEVKLVKG